MGAWWGPLPSRRQRRGAQKKQKLRGLAAGSTPTDLCPYHVNTQTHVEPPLFCLNRPCCCARARDQSSMPLGQFRHAGCDKNAKLMPTEQEIGQNHQKLPHYYLFLRLIKSTKAVTRCCSLHLWLRTGEYSIKMTAGARHIDLQHEITPLSMLISHLPPV